MRERHYYAGANSPQGFVSFYDQIAWPKRDRFYILKGGPGLGKATLMREAARVMQAHGLLVEFTHCSADLGALDAVYAPEVGLGLVDGTAPHAQDPTLPGAVDILVSLGDYLISERLAERVAELTELRAETSFWFRRCYDALRAAEAHHQEREAYASWGLPKGKLDRLAADLADKYLPPRPGPGAGRHLFAGAITPEGPVNHLKSLMDPLPQRLVFTGPPGSGKATLIGYLAAEAQRRGYAVEYFHCPFQPEQVEHAIIQPLGLGLIKAEGPHPYQPLATDQVIETGQWVTTRFEGEAAAAEARWAAAYQGAVDHLRRAHQNHLKEEQLYGSAVNWAGVEARKAELLAEIEQICKAKRPGSA